MSKKSEKAFIITAAALALIGIACFIVKLVEATMRTAHDWAETFVILGFVFVGLALLVVCLMVVIGTYKEKNLSKKADVSDEELLAKYKSKKTK